MIAAIGFTELLLIIGAVFLLLGVASFVQAAVKGVELKVYSGALWGRVGALVIGLAFCVWAYLEKRPIKYDSAPVGTVMALAGEFTKELKDAGWALCDGSGYPHMEPEEAERLEKAIGGKKGGRYGKRMLPDYRGLFLRGVDGSRGKDPGRDSRMSHDFKGKLGGVVGSTQRCSVGPHDHNVTVYGGSRDVGKFPRATEGQESEGNPPTGVQEGNETRPVNVYVYWIIKVK